MALDIQREVTILRGMTVKQLQEKYVEVFGEKVRTGNRDFLVKRIAWRLQANSEGGLSERAQRRAEELANESDLRIRAPKDAFCGAASAPTSQATVCNFTPGRDERLPPPNTVLTRTYKGRAIEVTVLEHGFLYDGAVFDTLSAVAKAVTGSHWNGFAFFNI